MFRVPAHVLPSLRLLSLTSLVALSGVACTASPSDDAEEPATGTEDITATQSFSNVCATSANMSTIAAPSTGPGASVLYVARCPASGPGRISRVDFAANTSVDIATFATKDAQIYFTDAGADFAVWQVLTTKTSGLVRRIERKIGLWDKSLAPSATPPARDMRALFPRAYDDATAGWVDWTAYAGAGRILAGWESQYRTRQLGLVSLTTGAPVWTAAGTILTKSSGVRATADRKEFLVDTERGPYVVDVAASTSSGGASVRALDQKLLPKTQSFDASGNFPGLDPKRVLMQSVSADAFKQPTWTTVDLATGARTDLGLSLGYAEPLGDAWSTSMLASDGTPAAVVSRSGGGVEVRVVTPSGIVASGALPDAATRLVYVAPKGAFVVAAEWLAPVPDPRPWEKNKNARYWVTRPATNAATAAPVALEAGAVLSRAAGTASPQERADGVNLFFYGLDSAWRLIALDAAGATTKSVIVPGRSLIPLQPGRALVDTCVIDLTGPAPVPAPQLPNGCIEGVDRPNTWPWVAKEGARVFALVQGPDVLVFRY
jgi:hypothetical protein